MIQFPNAKINLGLNVVEKRNDGYHNLETIFYPLPIFDSLEVIETNGISGTYEFSSSGISVDGPLYTNIVIRALELIAQEYKLPALKIHLHKVIPMGGGLGGGSSDGAFMLKMLNDMFSLGLNNKQLMDLAAKLGADCPFFIHNQSAYATGIGEILDPIDISLSNVYLLLLNPVIHVSTALAFSKVLPKMPAVSVKNIIQTPRANWKNMLINDFESSVFDTYPIIREIKESLYLDGAFYSSMSGSGASVYALFDSKPENISFPKYLIWEGYLK